MHSQKIIDIHTHVFPEKIAYKASVSIGKYYGITMSGSGTVADLVNSAKNAGIHRFVIHSTATKEDQVKAINDFVAQVQADYTGITGFGTLHPGMKDPELEVDRILSYGLKGVKLHPEFQNFNIDDRNMMRIYRVLEGRLPILMHTGDQKKTSSSPIRLAKILDKFPSLTVIAAHLGGYQRWDEALEHIVGRSNVYLDTSSSLFRLEPDKAAEIIRKHGVDRVLFGTDYPMWTHKDELDRFYRLGLTSYENRLILWENAEKLLKIL